MTNRCVGSPCSFRPRAFEPCATTFASRPGAMLRLTSAKYLNAVSAYIGLPSFRLPQVAVQERVRGFVEVFDGFLAAPAVSLALVEVVDVRGALASQGIDDGVRLGARHHLVVRALVDRERPANP